MCAKGACECRMSFLCVYDQIYPCIGNKKKKTVFSFIYFNFFLLHCHFGFYFLSKMNIYGVFIGGL